MALPQSIPGGIAWGLHSFPGPILVGGAIYAFLPATAAGGSVRAMKLAAPDTGSWTEVDSLNRPTIAKQQRSCWVALSGTTIHMVVAMGGGNVQQAEYHYHTFNTSTDTWAIKNELIHGNFNNTPVAVFVTASLALRSDGDVIILYNGTGVFTGGTTQARVKYARREAGVWTVNQAVDPGGSFHMSKGRIVLGAADRMHFFWLKDDGTTKMIQHRALTSANALQATSDVDATIFDSPRPGTGASYVSGVNTKVRLPYLDASQQISVAKFDSADAPSITTDVNVSEIAVSGDTTMGLAADGTTLHLMYIRDNDRDVWRDKNADGAGWGVDEEAKDNAADITQLSVNSYTRAGIAKLAFLYTVTYDEIPLAAVGLTISNVGAIPSAEGFGFAVVAGPLSKVGAIPSAEAFGTPSVTLTTAPPAVITPGSILSAEAFGTPSITVGGAPLPPESTAPLGVIVRAKGPTHSVRARRLLITTHSKGPILKVLEPE